MTMMMMMMMMMMIMTMMTMMIIMCFLYPKGPQTGLAPEWPINYDDDDDIDDNAEDDDDDDDDSDGNDVFIVKNIFFVGILYLKLHYSD